MGVYASVGVRTMKLSIIVPVSKVEPYIRRCVDSILAQTFTDFELILVDDGSPDNCPAICDEYAVKDHRVKVIHKKNGGLSDARNAGLDIAQGEYIGFVDSDDWILPDMYRTLTEKIEAHDADICAIGFCELDRNGEVLVTNAVREPLLVLNREDFIGQFFPDNKYFMAVCVWNKIYKRDLFQTIRFPRGVIYEDTFVQLPILDLCQRVAVIGDVGYCYRMERPESIMNGLFGENNLLRAEAAYSQYQFFAERKMIQQQEYALENYVRLYLITFFSVEHLNPELKGNFRPYLRVFRSLLAEILKNPKICRMKKMMCVASTICEPAAYWLAKRYFPECLPKELR